MADTEIRRVVLTEDARAGIAWLPGSESARLRRAIESLTRRGWAEALKTRLVRPLRRQIYELRVPGHGSAYRMTCFPIFAPEGVTVVVVEYVPKARWKPRRVTSYIERAERARVAWRSAGKGSQ